MKLRWAVLWVFSVAASALAAAPTGLAIRPKADSTLEVYTFRQDECGKQLVLQWHFPATSLMQACGQLRLWSTTGACGDNPGTGDKVYSDIQQTELLTRIGDFPINIDELPAFTADGGTTTPCGAEGIELTQTVCGSLSTAQAQCGIQTTPTITRASALALKYDTKPPPIPTVGDPIEPQDSALRVTFTVSSDASKVRAQYREIVMVDGGVQNTGNETWTNVATVSATAGAVSISDLVNGKSYWVRLSAIDAVNNESEFSEPVIGTPRRELGFWNAYAEAGGTEMGGCSAAPLLWLPGVAVLAFLLRRRRS